MIQRIQSVYWLVVTIILVVAMFLPIGYFGVEGAPLPIAFKPLGVDLPAGGQESTWGVFGILVLAAVVALGTIFLYKNRMLQVRTTVFSTVLLLGYYLTTGVFIYTLKDSLGASSFTPGMGLALPLVCIILNYLAFRNTYADEVMVRAADRLR